MDHIANIVLKKLMATREQRVRQKKKEQEAWLESNLADMIEHQKFTGASDEHLAQAIQEVFDEDIREIITGKRSKQ